MKHQILNVKFKVFPENVDMTMKNLEQFCDVAGVTYTYSVKNRFFPMKSVIKAEFEGPDENIEAVERYVRAAHGVC